MKKTIRVLMPIILAAVIIVCTVWYLFIYDREFTRDMLLNCARYAESQGSHKVATWFYNQAYFQAGNNEAVAIELAEQYKNSGNYTKAEYTLSNAIQDGGGIDLYIALCKTYVEQDKLKDAVDMLNNITNEDVRQQLYPIRPTIPTPAPEPGFYNQYISVSLGSENALLYVSSDGQYPSTMEDAYTGAVALADGENTIKAVAVADNGLVSQLYTYGYTVGGIVEEVHFADTAVEAAIRTILNANENTQLFTSDLRKITEFTVPADATSYADLRHMTLLEKLTVENAISSELPHISKLSSLAELKLTNTTISNELITAVGSFSKLKKLELTNCGISSITPLSGLTELEFLDLSENTIRSIDTLTGMIALKELNLRHNAVSELGALTALSALTKLDVSYNSVSTLSPICNLSSLTWLDAGHNAVISLDGIEKLTSLTYLDLAANQITNASSLEACTALTDLDLSENKLSDISSLRSLTELMYFDFSHNAVTQIPDWPKACALVTINGSHNQIETLAPLSGLEHLNNVHMDYNEKIFSVKELASCPVLIEVNVYATSVTDVTSLTDQSIIVNYNPVTKSE